MRRATKLTLVAAWIFSTLPSIQTPSATAVTVGSGNCIQNVGSATGVTVTTYSDRCVVKFTSTAATTWSVPRGVTKVWVLVVAGGGGGGSDEGGGGGAGGYVENQNFAVTSQATISIDVGYAGSGASNAVGGAGFNGGSSTFSSLTAAGGGGGGSAVNSATAAEKNGRLGGSGGGGSGAESYGAGTYGAGTAGQGQRGDAGTSTRGGGGGGAGQIGDTNGTARGGDGKATTILNGSTSTTFAGGGGGGGGNSASGAVAGGAGGGGAGGGNATCPVAGTANTGGGGGGAAGATCSDFNGADGGSGIIVVNYQFDITSATITSSTSVSINENTSTSTTILTIKASESTTMVIASSQDSADFTLIYSDSITSVLRFAISPDFEGPADVGQNNVYDFTLNLEDYSGNTSTQAFIITVNDLSEGSIISAPSLSASPYKGITVTISITTNAHGKILFTANGKRIANCVAVRTTGTSPNYSATCSWKPAVMGRVNIKAVLTPTSNTFSPATSESLATLVLRRTTTR